MTKLQPRLLGVLIQAADELDLPLTIRQLEKLSNVAASKLTPPPEPPPSVTIGDLTGQQLTVLLGLAAGERVADTARRLWTSEHTVRSHKLKLFRKLGVHTSGQAVARAKDLGLLRKATALPLPGAGEVQALR